MVKKEDTFSEKVEYLKDSLEKPVYNEQQINVFNSDYVDNYDEALAVLESKDIPDAKYLEKNR